MVLLSLWERYVNRTSYYRDPGLGERPRVRQMASGHRFGPGWILRHSHVDCPVTLTARLF